MQELTPRRSRCAFEASCPAVYLDGDQLVIVGEKSSMDGTGKTLGADEAAVRIDRHLVAGALAGPVSRFLMWIGL